MSRGVGLMVIEIGSIGVFDVSPFKEGRKICVIVLLGRWSFSYYNHPNNCGRRWKFISPAVNMNNIYYHI